MSGCQGLCWPTYPGMHAHGSYAAPYWHVQDPLDGDEGYWTFINVLGAEEGPYSVAQLREMLHRCAANHRPKPMSGVQGLC